MGRASPVQFSLTDERSRQISRWLHLWEAMGSTWREPKQTVAVATSAVYATSGGAKYSTTCAGTAVKHSWTERSGRIDGTPINRNEERMAQEHGQTNCEACHRRIIEIRVHCRLQHGEDKQESHHELAHQSIPIAPSFSDSRWKPRACVQSFNRTL